MISPRRRRRRRRPARRRGAVPHRVGPAVGRRPRPLLGRASPARAWIWPSGSPTTASPLTGCDTWSYGPVPAEDPDAAVRRPPDAEHPPRRGRRREPLPERPRPRRRREFLLVIAHSEAARRHRRLGRAARHRLTEPSLSKRRQTCLSTSTSSSSDPGAGGGTLAHALAPTGKRILILERGDYLRREKQNWDATEVWIKHRYRNSGKLDRQGRRRVPAQAALLRRRQHEDVRRRAVPQARARLRRRPPRRRACPRRGRSPTPTWSRTTPAPSSSTTCTASARSTRSSRGRPATSRTRRSATSRASSSCPPTSKAPGCTRSTCRSGS